MREWLKKIRKDADFTQAEIARASGISREYYTRIETGQRGKKLPVSTAQKIASILDFAWTRFYEEKDAG